MDVGTLKTLIPILILALTGLIAIVKVKSLAETASRDLKGIQKDVDRLEKQSNDWSRTTVRLEAQLEQAEKNITKLWAANEGVQAREDKAHDRLDDRFTSLRDRFGNGNRKSSE